MRKGCDSELGPTPTQLAAAILDGVTFWAWYAGGAGASHVWFDGEVAVLAAGGLVLSLPIVVPPYSLATDPATDYLLARARVIALGWSPVLAADTEHIEDTNPRLVPWVDGWNATAERLGDPPVVYGGGGYVGSAHPWWIWPRATAVPLGSGAQVGPHNYSGLAVDVDLVGDLFPLSLYRGGSLSAYGNDAADPVTADRDERRCVIRDWWARYRGPAPMSDAEIYVAMLTWAAHGGEATREAIVDGAIA